MSEYQGCNKCKFQNTHPSDYPCRKCKNNMGEDNYAPMTNADRIRNMDVSELAEFLVKVNGTIKDCMTIGDCKWEDYPTHDKGCKDCFLEWLQAEVKEG